MKRRLIKFTVMAVLAVVVIGGVFAAGYFLPELLGTSKSEPVISGAVLQKEIAELSELAVMRCRYNNVGAFEDPLMLKDWKVPFTKKSFIVSYKGDIKLGIDASQLRVDISEALQSVVIYLPEITVLSHEIDEDSVEVWDQTSNIFNPIKIEDYTAFVAAQKAAVEKSMVTEELKEEALQSVEAQIHAFVSHFAGIKDEYDVLFGAQPDAENSEA